MMKQKFDILLLCQFFYPEYVSSATLPFDTAEALAQDGYRVGVLCGYPKEYSDTETTLEKENYKGILINRLRYIQMNRAGFFGRAVNSFSFLAAVMSRLAILGRCRCVLVYSNPPMLPWIAALAKLLFQIKIIFVCYDVYPEIGINTGKIKEKSAADFLFRTINKTIFRSADQIVALSEDMKSYLCKNRNYASGRVSVIPNWAAFREIRAKNARSNPIFSVIPKTAFVVSYLGNLGICQEEQALLETFRLLQSYTEIHFLIAGHGNKMPMLRETAARENLAQVHFFGFLKGEDYEDALGFSDVFIVTLARRMRGLCSPSKASSYLMAGRPVIVEAEAGIELAEDIVNRKCGYRIEPNDFEAMKNCILEQYEDTKLNAEMGRNSRLLFKQKYEKEICLAQYKKLIKKMLR